MYKKFTIGSTRVIDLAVRRSGPASICWPRKGKSHLKIWIKCNKYTYFGNYLLLKPTLGWWAGNIALVGTQGPRRHNGGTEYTTVLQYTFSHLTCYTINKI